MAALFREAPVLSSDKPQGIGNSNIMKTIFVTDNDVVIFNRVKNNDKSEEITQYSVHTMTIK